MQIVIVGGGASGASCAARLRRLDDKANIIVLEKTSDISVANCGLPYYLSGVISDRDNMLVSSPEEFKNLLNVDVKTNSEVTKIKTFEKTVIVNSGQEYKYDKLVLALGASPMKPQIKGMGDNVFTVRNLIDADKIKEFAKEKNVKKAVVIGGGFIGVEMAENFIHLGIDTCLVEQAPQILAPIDEDMVVFAQNEIRDNGVKLFLDDGVKEFEDNAIILNSGRKIEFDIAIMAIGVKPDTALLKDTKIELNERGYIKVDEFMKTSVVDVYAAGDSVEVKDFVTKSPTTIALAGPANRQGRIIADNICGKKSIYKDTQGTAIVKVFNKTIASVGLNERQLKQKNISYQKMHIWGNSHASYYPDAFPIFIKLIFGNDGELFGAQAVGYDAVDKRMDVIASIMRMGGKVQDLVDAELCYAPPYSSAKDPVNILGMAASNVLDGVLQVSFFEDIKDDVYLIDVRPPIMFKTNTILGAVNIPVSKLRNSVGEIPKDKKVVLFCNKGFNSYIAHRILKQNGVDNVSSLTGGMMFYNELKKNKES